MADLRQREWSAVMLEMYLSKSIDDDLLPPLNMAGYFGMGATEDVSNLNQNSLDVNVFGAWKRIKSYGLMTKHELLDTIRTGNIQEFFQQAVRKLASIGDAYAMEVIDSRVRFDTLPALKADPPPNLVYDLQIATEEALRAYRCPRFQTQASKLASWERVETLATAVLDARPHTGPPYIKKVLKSTMDCYDILKEYYEFQRPLPRDLKIWADWLVTMEDSE